MSGIIALIVYLVVLAIAVWIIKAVLAQMGAPAVMFTVTVGIACIIAVVLIANFLGAGIPLGV